MSPRLENSSLLSGEMALTRQCGPEPQKTLKGDHKRIVPSFPSSATEIRVRQCNRVWFGRTKPLFWQRGFFELVGSARMPRLPTSPHILRCSPNPSRGRTRWYHSAKAWPTYAAAFWLRVPIILFELFHGKVAQRDTQKNFTQEPPSNENSTAASRDLVPPYYGYCNKASKNIRAGLSGSREILVLNTSDWQLVRTELPVWVIIPENEFENEKT